MAFKWYISKHNYLKCPWLHRSFMLRVLLCLQSVLTSFKSVLRVDNECKLKEIFFARSESSLMHKNNKEKCRGKMQISDKVFKYHAALLPFFLRAMHRVCFLLLLLLLQIHDMPKKSSNNNNINNNFLWFKANVFFTEKKLKVKRKIR